MFVSRTHRATEARIRGRFGSCRIGELRLLRVVALA